MMKNTNTIEELLAALPKNSQKKLKAIMEEADKVLAERALEPKMITMYHVVYEWSYTFQGRKYREWCHEACPNEAKLQAKIPAKIGRSKVRVTQRFTRRVKNSLYWTEEPVVCYAGDREWVL